MNKHDIALMVMTLLGVCHVGTFIYLRKTGKHPEVYEQLKISKWIIVLLLLVGLMMGGIYIDNKMDDAPTLTKYAIALGATLIVPLTILGVVWLNFIGRFLMAAIAGLFIK